VDGRTTVVHGGELLRVLPGQRYGTGDWPEEKGRLAWLILKSRPAPRGPTLGMSAAGARAVFELLADPTLPRLLPLPADAPQLIDSIFNWWGRRNDELGREIIRNRLAALVLGAAHASAGAAEVTADRASHTRIERVLGWIDEHPDEPATNKSLAQLAGLSSARFHVHFKNVTGCSPKDYLLRQRVARAAARLKERPDLTVTRVAHDTGFSSSQYFATVFRRYAGMSPMDYRRRA
jgi:AraC-like DNA-binding protein